jgi:hypothetical protein
MSVFGFCNNKCKHEVYTKEEVDTKLEDVENILNLGTISKYNYSRGTEIPTGGSDGDIYDQYFE